MLPQPCHEAHCAICPCRVGFSHVAPTMTPEYIHTSTIAPTSIDLRPTIWSCPHWPLSGSVPATGGGSCWGCSCRGCCPVTPNCCKWAIRRLTMACSVCGVSPIGCGGCFGTVVACFGIEVACGVAAAAFGTCASAAPNICWVGCIICDASTSDIASLTSAPFAVTGHCTGLLS